MIKVVYCFRKKPGLSDEAFFDYWHNVHGPIGARIPGMQRLVQSRMVRVPGDAHSGDFDGMAELWFDNVEALLAARNTPEWEQSTKDEQNFIDHHHVAYFVAEEHEITVPATG